MNINNKNHTTPAQVFFSDKNLFGHMIHVGNFLPADIMQLSKINKLSYFIIHKNMNNYWKYQYCKLEYPRHVVNRSLLFNEFPLGNPNTHWIEQFTKQKKRELIEKKYYRIIKEFYQEKTDETFSEEESKLKPNLRPLHLIHGFKE